MSLDSPIAAMDICDELDDLGYAFDRSLEDAETGYILINDRLVTYVPEYPSDVLCPWVYSTDYFLYRIIPGWICKRNERLGPGKDIRKNLATRVYAQSLLRTILEGLNV